VGALALYLNFINPLFALLPFLGRRRDQRTCSATHGTYRGVLPD
jgi:hypothetical protein